MRLNLVLATLIVVLLQAGLCCQAKTEITVPWIYSGGRATVETTPGFHWLKDGRLLLESSSDGRTWVTMDPATGETAPALDVPAAMKSLEGLLGRAPRALPFPSEIEASSEIAIFPALGDLLVFDLKKAAFQRVGKEGQEESSPAIAPNGRFVSFVRRNDLYVADLTTGEEHRMTTDGTDLIKNGTLSWVYWEEIFGRQDQAVWWSPDSQSLAFLRSDDSLVSECIHLDFQPAVPEVHKQRYPKAGEPNPVVRLGIADLANRGPTTWVTLDANTYEYLVRVKWMKDGKRLFVQTLDRQHRNLDLWVVDRATGNGKRILRETDPAWVNVHDDLYEIEGGKQFLWVSERDGFAHLYRYSIEGEQIAQITKGPFALHAASPVFWLRKAVTAIDEKNGWIYFGALNASIVETHLYRCKMDGSEFTQLTSERGVHTISMSPDAKYFVDEHSSAASPPSLRLASSSGEVLATLAAPKTEVVNSLDIVTPELMKVPARDGYQLPVALYRPKDFDPKKKYPVIFHIYGGPSSRSVTDAWDRDIYWNQLLLRKGYLVANIDNRSATGESKAIENTVHLKMTSDGELNDLVDGVRWFKAQPWIDSDRCGIWGWSNGGMMTLLAMTRSTEFKAGISVAPVTDWTYYDTIWAETVNKTPQENPDGYEHTNLVKRAKDLKGRLLLVHGTYDDNVHIQNAWHFVDELVKANILFEMQIYPMRQHGISDRPARIHLFTTMLDFWSRSL